MFNRKFQVQIIEFQFRLPILRNLMAVIMAEQQGIKRSFVVGAAFEVIAVEAVAQKCLPLAVIVVVVAESVQRY